MLDIGVAGRRRQISVCSSIFTRASLARGRRVQIPESRIRRTVQQAVEDLKRRSWRPEERHRGPAGTRQIGTFIVLPATVSSWASGRRWGLAGAVSTQDADESGPLIEERRVRHRGWVARPGGRSG